MIKTFLSLISSPVFAQDADNPPKLEVLFDSIDKIMGYIFPFAALAAVAMIVYGGYMWMISGGDPSKKQIAQGTLTWSVIGLIFLFLIRLLLSILVDFFVEGRAHY
jgi:hypothetical protein